LASKSTTDALPFLRGGGEKGALFRAYDLDATPLGSPELWPLELKTAVGLMLVRLSECCPKWRHGMRLLQAQSSKSEKESTS
jgi:hypothetical protein